MDYRKCLNLLQWNFLPSTLNTEKLSDAIEAGIPFVEETDHYRGCAIGTGYRARTGRILKGNDFFGTECRMVAETFKMPHEVVTQASDMHWRGASRQQVATWLRSKGY